MAVRDGCRDLRLGVGFAELRIGYLRLEWGWMFELELEMKNGRGCEWLRVGGKGVELRLWMEAVGGVEG